MGFFGNILNAGKTGFTGGVSGGVSASVAGRFNRIGLKSRERRQLRMQKELNEQTAQLNYDYGEQAAESPYQFKVRTFC